MSARRRLAVVGGGWAGIAAAVEATLRGHNVHLFEMAPQLGGRARSFTVDGIEIDNGQHIAIGAYAETLALLARVGIEPARAFLRLPLRLVDPDGVGLRLRPGAPSLAFAAAVLAHPTWRWDDKLGLLGSAAGWAARGFRCDPAWTVQRLASRLSPVVQRELIEPLCVAALNTEAGAASAGVFLRVLKDALFSGPGASDLLLPRLPLSGVLAGPAGDWLRAAGADLRLGHRAMTLQPRAGGWDLDGVAVDGVILASTATEAARLALDIAPAWSQSTHALAWEPIVTVYAHGDAADLDEPMLALEAGPSAPAQFAFNRGRLGGPPGLLAFVVSGARDWVARGADATWVAVQRQAQVQLAPQGVGSLRRLKTVVEHRATFRCVPGLTRPAMTIGPNLLAAGDYVDGPYPATLEGAVRSGIAAARHFG
ncbi:MAG: hydroxysqualene dehydroxylase HpnE [Burkholderiaceae bacterium]